jgi:hypothetical protein
MLAPDRQSGVRSAPPPPLQIALELAEVRDRLAARDELIAHLERSLRDAEKAATPRSPGEPTLMQARWLGFFLGVRKSPR